MNYLAIAIATIASFALGALWYGPVFGKTWMKLEGLTMESLKTMPLSAKQAMGLCLVNTIIMTAVLAWLIGALQITTIGEAVKPMFLVWLGLVATNTASDWLWKGKSFNLFLFNVAEQAVSIALATIILVSLA
jgi:hypothetical protein